MARINIYIKKDKEELINQGKKKGIKPSKALVEGYKLLLGKTATYSILEEKRELLLKEISDVECQMEKIRDEIVIDPTNQKRVLKDIARGYLNENIINDSVLDVRRVELNLTLDEMRKIVQDKVVNPIDTGELSKINLDYYFEDPEEDHEGIDRAKSFFRNQFEREGKLNEGDLKRWAYGLDLESEQLLSILEGELYR